MDLRIFKLNFKNCQYTITTVSQIVDSIDKYNKTASYNIITVSLIKSVVKEATNASLKDNDSMDNRVVYLGRNSEYYKASIRDKVNKKFIFYLRDSCWKYLHNKCSDKEVWIFNKAFLTYAIIGKAKTNNWKFRLVADYRNYLTVIPFVKPGCFYSRELKEIKVIIIFFYHIELIKMVFHFWRFGNCYEYYTRNKKNIFSLRVQFSWFCKRLRWNIRRKKKNKRSCL